MLKFLVKPVYKEMSSVVALWRVSAYPCFASKQGLRSRRWALFECPCKRLLQEYAGGGRRTGD